MSESASATDGAAAAAKPQQQPWPQTRVEKEFARFVKDGEYGTALNGFERTPGGCVRTVVARPTPVTYKWLQRIDGDTHPPTAKLSRDMHVQASSHGVSVTFCTARDQIVALRHEERKLKRGGAFTKGVAPLMEDVPAVFRAQGIAVARKAWEVLPTSESHAPRVRYMPGSKQLDISVACFPDALVTYQDLHQFVHATCAVSAWCESTKGDTPLLIVGARVPVTLATERGREREGEETEDHGAGGGSAKRGRF